MIAVFLFLFSLTHIRALPQGAPTKVCQTMMPIHGHGGGIAPQNDISPYIIDLRRQNGGVIVTLKSDRKTPFQGFMLQARTSNRELLGVFQPSGNDAHTIDCTQSKDTLTHNGAGNKEMVEVEWQPPEDFDGTVIFNATFAQNYQIFWVGVESQAIKVGERHANDPVPPAPSRPKSTTPPNFFFASDPFYEGCGVRKLCFGAPANCIKSRNCKAVTAVTVSGERYEFEMKANVNPGWVGVGLSDDDKMGDDSVIECVKDGNRPVRTYMSWTSGPPDYGAARLSNPQLGIRLLNSSVVDSVLYCRVQREVRTKVNGRIFDLANAKYHLLVAAGDELATASVGFHSLAFLSSANQQSLSDVTVLAAASKLLIRLHGSFMLTAWIGTVSIGTLLARYYRTTWVERSLCGKDIWFALHRMFMLLTWALTMTAFVLIFVKLGAWSAAENPHAILGTCTTVLCFLQPIGAYFRPHPGTPKRPYFNWVHWFGGNAAHIVGLVTIFYAVKLRKAELPDFMNWILVAYVTFHVIIHLILSIMGGISERSSVGRVTDFFMKNLFGSGRNSAYADRNEGSLCSLFRKLILALYILVVIGLVVILIVIIALAPIEE